MQKELDSVRYHLNNHKIRKQNDKATPSGASPEQIYSLYEDYGGIWCLQEVDRNLVREIMDDVAAEHDTFDWGVPAPFAT